MRGEVDKAKIRQFMVEFGRAVKGTGRVYFTGGVTALLFDWRPMTVDIDLLLDPEPPAGFATLKALKDHLDLNVEQASPADFIPELPGWRERSEWIARHGSVDYYHYDLYSQALAKIARSFERDLSDVDAMLGNGKIDPDRLCALFDDIRPSMERYPRLDEDAFAENLRRAVELFRGRFRP